LVHYVIVAGKCDCITSPERRWFKEGDEIRPLSEIACMVNIVDDLGQSLGVHRISRCKCEKKSKSGMSKIKPIWNKAVITKLK